MQLSKTLTSYIFSFIFCVSLSAQSKDTITVHEDDSTKTDKWFDFKWDRDEFQFKGSPTISLSYGQSKIKHQNFKSSFTKPNLLELKLGYTSINPSKYSEDILKYTFNYSFLSNYWTKNDISSSVNTDMWRFGFGWVKGYGYNLGESSIIPYHSTSISWSRVKFKDAITDSSDALIAERFNESFRFGSAAEAGIRVQIIPLLSLDVSYERSIIFERHLFWKWAGSGIIEAASQGMLDHFIKKIGKSSPMALPIVSFVLKSALSYGIYELRQEKMNWPFKSAAPLSNDQWKVGVTFSF